ncbi:SGNH/GDSL hydrolase family protein [Microbacterium sp. KKR3/1]|uniref:SGNH/GDSL hydrolase family protein n=1 Tax=Microbacterium sp. KKR3/1 TaxID=2904241 RepID=UPI001E36483E|nr:SGNH/GDSL hydrolase family protein [Microbacterium sp. KKR3/1]MCE0510832.1 SGNH/GDSL hydrolase family protein [Microbacterium sp. KKR3/1]
MTVTLKISGDDLTGVWDSELTAANPLIVADTISGVPWYRVTSSAATKIIGKSPLGSPSTTYFGFRYRATGNPSSSQVILHPFTSGGSTSFRLRRGSTGTIILDGASSNGLDTSSVTATNTDYAITGSVSATAASVTITAADGTTVIDTISATNTFGLVDNWRMGQIGSSPALPDWLFRMLLVSDTPVTAAMVLETPDALGATQVGIIGDSNMGGLGDNSYYYDAFVDAGLSTRDVYFWGVGGKRIAVADLTGKTAANNIADATAWLGSIDTWVIALGTNDRPQSDSTINADIDTLLTAIGGTAKIIWIGLTSKATASTDDIRVNGLIQAKLTARGNAEFADWDTYIRGIDGGANPSPYWLTTDSTHMTPLGYEVRSAYVASLLVDDTPVDVDGTGVLTLSGSASRTVTVGRSATATLGVSGAASVTVAVDRSGSGALVLAGAATRALVVDRGASGGLGLNGSAESSLTVDRDATGELVLVGAATTAGAADRTAEGTLGLGGTATFSVSVERTGTSALSLSGTATVTAEVGRAADAVLSLGGVGSVAFSIMRNALGALALTGTAHTGNASPVPDVRTLTAVDVGHTLTPVGFTRTLEDA